MLLALALAVAAHSSPADDCAAAKKKAVLYAMGLRAYCSKDSDCADFNVTGAPCERPEVFRKDAHVADDKNLQELQKKVADACRSSWAMAGACIPYKAKPTCQEGKCVDTGGVDVPAPAPAAAPAKK